MKERTEEKCSRGQVYPNLEDCMSAWSGVRKDAVRQAIMAYRDSKEGKDFFEEHPYATYQEVLRVMPGSYMRDNNFKMVTQLEAIEKDFLNEPVFNGVLTGFWTEYRTLNDSEIMYIFNLAMYYAMCVACDERIKKNLLQLEIIEMTTILNWAYEYFKSTRVDKSTFLSNKMNDLFCDTKGGTV